MLNNLPGVTSVHGRFYDLSSKYYRIIGNHAAYYKDALRYLGCVDIKDLPGRLKARWDVALWPRPSTESSFFSSTETEKQERAFTLGLAGLLGEGVYNFGELVCVWVCVGVSVWVCMCVNSPLLLLSADASCAGVFEEHRQAVAHRYSLRLQRRKRGEVPGLQVVLGPTGERVRICPPGRKDRTG